MSDQTSALKDQNPFLSTGAMTLADVTASVQGDDTLKPSRRRDLTSAVNRFCELLGRRPCEIPASATDLRQRAANLHPVQIGISAKRWANLRSDLMAALRLAGACDLPPARQIPLSPAWQSLFDACPVERFRWDLSRFARYCSAMEVKPKEVTDDIASGFLSAMKEAAIWKDPEQIQRTSIKRWNQARDQISSWPDIELTPLPPKRDPWTFPLDQFPRSFQYDLEAWINRLACADPLADDAPPKPLRPATLEHRAFQVRSAASALVRRNVPITAITSLADLVTIENFKAILHFLIDRFAEPTESVYGFAICLKAIAEHHVQVPRDQLDQLRAFCKRLKKRNPGLRPKNRVRLSQFDDPRNIAFLLNLPNRLAGIARRQSGRDGAVTMQLAVAVEILTMAPMRISNLANLKIDENLRWSRPGRMGHLLLHVDGDEVKNNEPIDQELPADSAKLMAEYIEKFRPLLFPEIGDWLFPGKKGGPKSRVTLGAQIRKTIQKHTGLKVNAHLMRHIAAKIYLESRPGAYEVVRRVLGHRDLDTTMNTYSGTETKSAGRHFDEVLLNIRNSPPPQKVRLRRKS
jgi:integrase